MKNDIWYLNIKLEENLNLVLFLNIEIDNYEIVISNSKFKTFRTYCTDDYTYESSIDDFTKKIIDELKILKKNGSLINFLESKNFSVLKNENLIGSLDKDDQKIIEEIKIKFNIKNSECGFMVSD